MNKNDKNKIFQDSTQGYISVPEKYVYELIDTAEMQRLKDVSQMGLRAVYSGATHDRFSHSLGVFHIGCQIYDAFTVNIERTLQGKSDELKKAKSLLNKWRKLFHTACILHDIGHPAFSHTLEYLFNSPYICIDGANQGGTEEIQVNSSEVERFYKRYSENALKNYSDGDKTFLKTGLFDEIRNKESAAGFGQYHTYNNLESFSPSPHEMMGAYLILTDGGLQDRIKNVCGKINNREQYAFIARMITGIKYDPIVPGIYSFELSLRNCVIGLLNGKIDADSLDYLNRNSHFAGYATSKLDLTRLCDSFSAYFDEGKKIFIPCLKKSALSTLDSFTSARNFEPKWLYGHHKIVYYNDFLIKFLVKMCGQYIFAMGQENLEEVIVSVLENTDSEFYKGDNGDKIKEIVSKFLKVKTNSGSGYNDWQEYFYKEIASKDSKNSLICRLADKYGPPALPIIEFIQINVNPSGFMRYKLLDFFIGLLNFQIDNVFKVFESDLCDEKKIKGVCEEFELVFGFISKVKDMFSRMRVSYTDYFFTPRSNATLKMDDGNLYKFNFSTDAHFRKLFLDFGIKFGKNSNMPKELEFSNSNDNARRKSRHRLFVSVLDEFKTRKLRPSLWKTYEEYNIFVNSLAQKHNISPQTIKEELKEVILCGDKIDFEDVLANLGESNSETGKNIRRAKRKKYEHVYTNYPAEKYVTEGSEKTFESVFGFLGDGLIIRFFNCKFKNFSGVPIQFENNIYRYGDVVNILVPEDFSFPYIYYDKEIKKDKQEILDKLGENLINHITKKISKKGENMSDSSFNTGKIIRDSVHGDIFVPNRFLKIIDCKAFQRLHRIKQLATADMLFPEAVHTRFAHSLGTFYITGLMMNHFCDILKELKIDCPQTEKDAILAAALLHDLGHGPYSHAYEHIGEKKKSHEDWTKEIIKNDSELKDVLENEFGSGFADKVISCLDKSAKTGGDYSLTNIFSEIISSNLDADRMDYLMRDAYNTGVKFGVFDLQKLISSMELIECEGKAKIALHIDAVPAAEQFIIGRYNMYSEVYFAPYKLALEKMLSRICERIDYINSDNDSDLYKLFHNLADLNTYLKTDDYSFMNEIERVSEKSGDNILIHLLESLKNRGGFKRIRMSDDDCTKFINNWKKVYPDAEQIKYGVLDVGQDFQAYKADDKEILVVSNNGVVKKFSDVSKLYYSKTDGNKLWHTVTGYVYFNEALLRCELEEMKKLKENTETEKIISDLKMLFDKYDANKHTEIENKYDCTIDSIQAAQDFKTVFADKRLKGFVLADESESRNQTDTYYDTKDFLLAKNKFSLRCRNKGTGEYVFTVKKPTATAGENKQAQFIRSEFEEKRRKSDINEAQDLLDEHLKSIDGKEIKISDLNPVVKIINDRKSFIVKDEDKDSGFKCEVSLDSIKYIDNAGNEKPDYQVEIELKCKYSYRLRMNKFAEIFCEVVGISGNSRAKESKYLKALTSLKLI